MLLTSGTRLGPYTIETLIGSGGMGEVYKAHESGRDEVYLRRYEGSPGAFRSPPIEGCCRGSRTTGASSSTQKGRE